MSIHQNLEHASTITYASGTATVLFWGLHLSDVAVIVSATASILGVSLQIWVAVTKVRLMKRSERWKAGDKK
jgi:hypothetical protein